MKSLIREMTIKSFGLDTLISNYQKETADLRNEISSLRRELDRAKGQLAPVQSTLRAMDLFCVADQVIEAPSPPVSQIIRDALEKSGYETVELYLASQIIRPGDTVLDMGSGLGLSAIAAAKATKHGRVVGYEADPEIALIAQKNIQRNGVNVELRNNAISREAGQIEFFISQDFLANSKFPVENSRKVLVHAASFQDAVNEIKPDVITCDIEGVEGEIFENADLSTVKCIIIETHPQFLGDDGVEKCIQQLATLGLKLVPELTWGPIIVCDRDGYASSVKPFIL